MINFADIITSAEDAALLRLSAELPDVRPIQSLPVSQALQSDVQPDKQGLFVVFAGYEKTNTEAQMFTIKLNFVLIGFFKSLRKATDPQTTKSAYSVMPRADVALDNYRVTDADNVTYTFNTGSLSSNLAAFPGWYIYELDFSTQFTCRTI